jgi:hypothetical protein
MRRPIARLSGVAILTAVLSLPTFAKSNLLAASTARQPAATPSQGAQWRFR